MSSGFGAAQGNRQVWLGSASGIVQSWSDTQLTAQVASGSTSGNAMILQNGAWSNPVPFSVNTLQISGISPTSGVSGTQVTITGTAFGALQGNGSVTIGGAVSQIATADGGLIATNTDTGAVLTFNQNGNATAQTAAVGHNEIERGQQIPVHNGKWL